MRRRLCIVLHDVAPATQAGCERVLRCIEDVAPALPVTLLAVPRYHWQASDAGFDHWLDDAAAQGRELALHGYSHLDEGTPHGWADHVRRHWYTAGEGEFSAMGFDEARRRLSAGVHWFRAHGWALHGFVAPAWLMSRGTWAALDTLPFEYTCTLASVVALPTHRRLRSQSLVYSTRSAWRRALSQPWNLGVALAQRQRELLRLELHPCDAQYPAIRRSWMHLLEHALDEREAVSLRDAAHMAVDVQVRMA
jgi:predicted deacetylase